MQSTVGGYIAQRLNWSWSFWVLSIFTSVLVLLSLILFRETYAPTILHNRAKSLRKTTSNPNIYTVYEKANPVLLTKLKVALTRPTKQLIVEPVIQLMSLYAAYSFGILYIVHSTFPTMWKDVYHQDMSHSGLNFLSIAVGFSIGGQIAGPTQDLIFKYFRKRSLNLEAGEEKTKEEMEAVPIIPEWRIPLMFPAALFVPIGLLIYGVSSYPSFNQEITNRDFFKLVVSTLPYAFHLPQYRNRDSLWRNDYLYTMPKCLHDRCIPRVHGISIGSC